jgi:hypothetical protein
VPPTGPLFELTDNPELPLRINEHLRYGAKRANNREDIIALGRPMLLGVVASMTFPGRMSMRMQLEGAGNNCRRRPDVP